MQQVRLTVRFWGNDYEFHRDNHRPENLAGEIKNSLAVYFYALRNNISI
jgi:cell division protein FtsI/penicillin-binding protein 2